MSTQEKLTTGDSFQKRIGNYKFFYEEATKIPSTKSSSLTTTIEKETDVKNKTTPFSWIQIFQALAVSESQNKNFVFSPCSIHLALSLLANGSTGSTLDELLRFSEANTLEDLNSDATNSVRVLTRTLALSFVSGIWVDKSCTLNPGFQSVAQSVYNGKAEKVDFTRERKSVADNINSWAEEATNGIIKDFVTKGMFDKHTRLVLANALYFKGDWTAKRKFDQSLTEYSEFFTLDGKSVRVPFMTNKEKKQFISRFHDFKVLRLPYEKSLDEEVALSMHIILPNERDGIWSLVQKAGSDLSFFDEYVHSNTWEVTVGKFKVPKFKITFEVDATNILKNLGLELPFSMAAEFGKMVELGPGRPLYVSSVVHKSYIEVDEKGAKAAACTGVFLKTLSWTLPAQPVDFVADHPFVFVIRDDNTGMVLFMGHIINPSLP